LLLAVAAVTDYGFYWFGWHCIAHLTTETTALPCFFAHGFLLILLRAFS
jgi:hypothetical protein